MDELKYYNSPITLEQAEQYIQNGLVTAARAYVANGYYLRRIRDDKLFEESGYQNFEDYVRGKYNKDKGWASKCIKVNQQLSDGGDSPILSKQYLEYSTYQLVELAYMTEEQREEADPDMTVNQLKQIRKPEEVVELEKSCDVTTSEPKEQDQESEELQDRTAYVKEQYRLRDSFLNPFAVWLIKNHKAWFTEDYMNRVIKVDKSEGQLKSYLGAYPDGSSSYGFPVDSETYYAKLYDNRIVISHFTDGGSVVVDGTAEWFYMAASIQVQWNVVALEEARAKEREDQEIEHFLNRNESIDDAYGWFRSAMVKEYLKSGYKDQNQECEISVLGSVHRVLKSEEVTLFYDDSGFASFDVENTRLEREYNYFFGHHDLVETDVEKPETVIEEPQNVPDQPETVSDLSGTVIDGEYEEILPDLSNPVKTVLEEAKKTLKDWMSAFEGEVPEKWPPFIERQKIIVAALEAMAEEQEQLESESQLEPVKQEQPELPILKNNDQRAAFIDAYETWPIWIETKETGERYYRYDLLDGNSMVVKVYHALLFDYKATGKKYEDRFCEGYGKHEYYFLHEEKFFRDCETNRSDLIEKLKELQKKK